jgi:hypothetical protein
MTDAEVFDVPVELGLESMTISGPDFTNTEGELVDDVIDKVVRVSLGMLLVDLERANAGGIVNGGILEAAYFPSLLSDESQERERPSLYDGPRWYLRRKCRTFSVTSGGV